MAYVTKRTARISRISLISYPLPLQECSDILLHYACQSESSTKALFDKLTEKVTKRKLVNRRAVKVITYKGIFVDAPLAKIVGLPDKSLEHIASQPVMKDKVKTKLFDEASMLMMHFVGLCTLGLIACYMRLTYLMQIGDNLNRLYWWIAGVIFFEVPLFIFEYKQAGGRGHFRIWASDTWNRFDVLSMIGVPIAIIVGFTRPAHERDRGTFTVVASIGGLLLMVKLLGFLKVLNEKLATYVLAIFIIMSDIKSFLIVLGGIFIAFGYAFFMLISNDKWLDLHDDTAVNVSCAAAFSAFVIYQRISRALLLSTRQPFGSWSETLLTVFNMGMLGEVDRNVFTSDFEHMLFVAYVTLVVIVMLNVLIAIVSDSYGALLLCVSLRASNLARSECTARPAQITRRAVRASSSCARGWSSRRISIRACQRMGRSGTALWCGGCA